jgi:hypothetical protein
MAGKSTYLRQNALIAILAQMGSFVPARRATIGARSTGCFSRVGAADDIARGRSTFMVEMVETAAILNPGRASARSVILDEIGRGTAPSTASPSPGPRSSTCTRATAAARCSPPTSTRLDLRSRPAAAAVQRHGSG